MGLFLGYSIGECGNNDKNKRKFLFKTVCEKYFLNGIDSEE